MGPLRGTPQGPSGSRALQRTGARKAISKRIRALGSCASMGAPPIWACTAICLVVSLLCLGLAPAGEAGLTASHTELSRPSPHPDPHASNGPNQIVATIPVGENPSTPAYDSGNGELYFSTGVEGGSPGNGTVYVVSAGTNTVAATIPVGTYPLAPVRRWKRGHLRL